MADNAVLMSMVTAIAEDANERCVSSSLLDTSGSDV